MSLLTALVLAHLREATGQSELALGMPFSNRATPLDREVVGRC